MCSVVGLEAWLRWLAHFEEVLCAGACSATCCFFSRFFKKWHLGFFGLFVSFVQNLPELSIHVVNFSPM